MLVNIGSIPIREIDTGMIFAVSNLADIYLARIPYGMVGYVGSNPMAEAPVILKRLLEVVPYLQLASCMLKLAKISGRRSVVLGYP